MPQPLQLKWLLVGLLALSSLMGCQSKANVSSLTQNACEQGEDFVWVKAGDYILGSDRIERDNAYRISAAASAHRPEDISKAEKNLRRQGWFDSEPDREVRSQPAVCMGKHLITNADYQTFVKATGHRSPHISAAEYQRQGFLVHPYQTVRPYLWQGQNYPSGEGQHPVVLVSYEDAQAYAQWRGQRDGQTYRLPSATEWEQTARGTDGRYFPWGNDWQDNATNWAKQGGLHTSAIATYPLSRSPDGIEDMAGNVFEYTSTFTQRLLQKATVMKGCSWDDLPGFCRAAYRHSRPLGSRHILFGFRLVKE
ncbi:SUMF1/EgtB/PvdO family nonheme iron enzyme [Acaryochloris sp. IP29b_bin.148]|uniref:formylglycine-generating enzyme family protein n=1 Tax=Acaryochloris sp. IP29b_bin.148 TaxID=2969218 RepID=UPI0026365FC0|nr:SUMF1/EgtB/PvdO family nonheme iron enzyme [Acaryochloris sp. IP29b_bin.148]